MATRRSKVQAQTLDAAKELHLREGLPTESTTDLPFETGELRTRLEAFLRHQWAAEASDESRTIGSYRWGIYAFYDYDGEPIYVGQTNEKLGTRIRRHLTNQRTDAVAMSVLDPYEVCYIEVWPIPELQNTPAKGAPQEAKAKLIALEYEAYQHLLASSRFKAVLNEKVPVEPETREPLPPSFRIKIVSDEVSRLRDHPDLRIARRAATLARLAKVIAERKVQKGLRVTLLTQARRLADLAERRVGGAPLNPDADTSDDEEVD